MIVLLCAFCGPLQFASRPRVMIKVRIRFGLRSGLGQECANRGNTKHRKGPQRTSVLYYAVVLNTAKDCTGPQRTPDRPQSTLQDFVNFLFGY